MSAWIPFRYVVAACLLALMAGCEAAKVRKPAWIGINTMLGYPDFDGAFPSAKTTPPQRERYFELVRELGSPPVRDLVMCWARAQPSPDATIDFSLSDELVTQAQARGIDVLALCWGVPGWATSQGPEGPAFRFDVPAREHEAAFRAFVQAFVERYDADGAGDMPGLQRGLKAYEFFQEMEDIPAETYAYWLRAFHESVKSADPAAIVSLGSLRSPGLPLPNTTHPSLHAGLPETPREAGYATYLERLLSAEPLQGPDFPYFDVVSFHSFPDSYPGHRPFDESLAYIQGVLADRGLSRPVWLTEFGCHAEPADETAQAARLVAWSLRARAIGIERAYIYCLWDYHWNVPGARVERLGLLREADPDGVPARKPAFTSVATLLRELSIRPEITRRDENVYMLSGEGQVAYAIWQEVNTPRELQFLTSDWWEVRTLTGQKLKRQGLEVPLTGMPIFVQRIESPFLQESPFMHNPLLGTPEEQEEKDRS